MRHWLLYVKLHEVKLILPYPFECYHVNQCRKTMARDKGGSRSHNRWELGHWRWRGPQYHLFWFIKDVLIGIDICLNQHHHIDIGFYIPLPHLMYISMWVVLKTNPSPNNVPYLMEVIRVHQSRELVSLIPSSCTFSPISLLASSL